MPVPHALERVDVVELEPAIEEVARLCAPVNFNVMDEPRVRHFPGDGREHLLTTSERYDVIVNEPSNPYRAGIASLFTVEFYRSVQDKLTDDGLFVQWLQAYDLSPGTVRTVGFYAIIIIIATPVGGFIWNGGELLARIFAFSL